MELGSHRRVGQYHLRVKMREMELDLQESPGEIKSRKMELGSHRKLDNPLLQLFLNSCFLDVVTLLRVAVETAISEVRKLRTNSLTSLFWR